jgi:hypothetical protein
MAATTKRRQILLGPQTEPDDVPATIRPQFEEFAFRLSRWSERRELWKYPASPLDSKMFNAAAMQEYLRSCTFEELNLFIAKHAFVMLGDLW